MKLRVEKQMKKQKKTLMKEYVGMMIVTAAPTYR